MSKITIKLSNSLSANKFGEEERIHHKAFEKVLDLIDDQKNACLNYDPEVEDGFRRCNNAISIFGERGVGKTSFLMSLCNHLKTVKEVDGENLKYGDIYLLPTIDPTLIEEKGHIFLLIISLLDKAVMNYLRKGNTNCDVDAYERSWSLKKALLAKGLPSLKLDGMTYHEPQWNEDEYVMNRGLESVTAAFELEKNFHKLVHLALDILGKKTFVLMFDDIDVDFKRGWDLLETARKFLTTPQMILIISGNMKLFSKNVRKQQWHNLGKELLINEKDEKGAHEYYNQLVNEIEGQYLLKILNSENRVYLYDVGRNIQMNGDEYMVDYGFKSLTLDESYAEVLRRFGVYGSSNIRVFIDFLESTSMRTQVHFLYNALQMEQNEDNNNYMAAISAFSSRIYGQNINIELAANADLFCSVLMHYMIEHKSVEDTYQLLPIFDDTDTNSVMSGFSFLFAILCRNNKGIVFDYLTKICTLRNSMRFLSYDKIKNVADFETYDDRIIYATANTFCKETGMFQKRNLRSIIGNAMATTISLNRKQTLDASVRILGFGGLAKEKKEVLINRIDQVLEGRGLEQVLGYLPLVCLLHSDKNERELYYSFNALIANVGQLIHFENKDGILQALMVASQPVSYQIKSGVSVGDNSEAELNAEIDISFDEDSLMLISEAIYLWKEQYSETCAYAPYLYGRIATRFFFAQANILDNSSNMDKGLGDLFSLMAMAFVNASLVEEMLMRGDNTKGLNINNIASSPKVLVDNIKYVTAMDNWKELIPFTRWLVTCPLLFPFIKNDTVRGFSFESICKGVDDDALHYLCRDVYMTPILNGISKQNRKQFVFSIAKDKINNTVNIINGMVADPMILLDKNNRQEAYKLLTTIFKSVSVRQFNLLINKCDITEDGKLVVKE